MTATTTTAWEQLDDEFFYVRTGEGLDSLLAHTRTQTHKRLDGGPCALYADNEGPQGYPTIVKIHSVIYEGVPGIEPTFADPHWYSQKLRTELDFLYQLDPTLKTS